ncbi:MAG: PAS domain S-box protein, partial [Clostridia bacterium]|nr:PAS domain S-box protein [Clostridia bacterium]
MGKERVFNQVLDSIPDLVFYKDLQGVYLGCNRAFAAFIGCDILDVVGQTDHDLFPSDLAQTFVSFDQAMLASGDPQYNQEWTTFPDGHRVLYDTLKAPMRDREGHLLGILGIARDITSQELVKQELKTTLANFRTFIETIDDMIFITDLNGRALYINPAVTTKLGLSLADLQDMHLLDVHPPELRETAEQIFAEMLAGLTEVCPLPLARKDGVRVPVETRVWMGRWDNQDCLFGICKDLSGEQEALQRFNKIFQVNPTPMMITTIPEGRILDVNDAFIATFGYRRLEAIGCLVSELSFFTTEEDADRAQAYLSSAEPLIQYEMSVRTRSNQILVGQISGEIVKTQSEDLRLTVMNDLTAIKKAEESLRYQAQFHNMLMKIATEYINVPLDHVSDAINNALREIGLFVDADRVYIFDYDFRRQTCSNTYEWCNTDINPEIDNLQEVPLAEIPDWANAHKNGVKMQIDDVLALPADNGVRQILEPQSV